MPSGSSRGQSHFIPILLRFISPAIRILTEKGRSSPDALATPFKAHRLTRVSQYAVALGIIFLANLVPAFAPPTWSILVYFTLKHDLHPTVLVPLGVVGATSGRAILALTFRAIRKWLPKGYVENMEAIGKYVSDHSTRSFGLLTLFFISPISSAQLFEAAGIIKRIKLKPLLFVFAGGRLLSYSLYASGAHALQASSLGEVFAKDFTSPKAIAVQVFLVLGLVALGNVNWTKRIKP